MLELRPSCEHCNKSLPPDSQEARICTFECTFCKDCVDTVLKNVCPNCGGGFVPRPIRPKQEWIKGVFLGNCPATQRVVYKPVNPEEQKKLIARQNNLPPEKR